MCAAEKPCARCHERPRLERGSYCRQCSNTVERESRKRRKEGRAR